MCIVSLKEGQTASYVWDEDSGDSCLMALLHILCPRNMDGTHEEKIKQPDAADEHKQ